MSRSRASGPSASSLDTVRLRANMITGVDGSTQVPDARSSCSCVSSLVGVMRCWCSMATVGVYAGSGLHTAGTWGQRAHVSITLAQGMWKMGGEANHLCARAHMKRMVAWVVQRSSITTLWDEDASKGQYGV